MVENNLQFSTKEQVLFWYWQYISRNKEYRECFEKVSTSIRNDNISTTEQYTVVCYDRFHCLPSNYNMFTDSNAIVLHFLEGNLDYSCHPPISIIDSFGELLEFVSVLNNGVQFNNTCFAYNISTQKSLKQVLSEVECLYKIILSCGCKQKHEESSKGLQANIRSNIDTHGDSILGVTGKTIYRQEGRVVGLWMYDYVESSNNKKRGIKSLAKEAFVKKFGDGALNKLGYSGSDNDTFRNLYDNAALCVEKAKLVPTS